MKNTLAIIKPDAMQKGSKEDIRKDIMDNGFKIVEEKTIHMLEQQAQGFYDIHKDKPFFGELVEFMTSAPVIVQVLKADGAVKKYRDVMGATNPDEAAEGTIRKDFAIDISENSVHGSDSDENSKIEIAQFFTDSDIVE